jgi:hypothetical protein
VVPLVRAGPAPASFAIALGTAVLFTLHPVQVYAVADPGQMELVLATLFGISMLRAYLEALVRSSRLLFFLSVALFVLAVLSKENVIAMPAVASVLTALVRRPSWAVIRALWPWYCLYGLIVAGVVIAEIDQPRDAPGRATADAVAAGDVSGEALRTRSAITQANQFFRYLTLWLVPHVGWMAIDLQYPLASRLSAWPESAGAVAFCLYPVAAGWLLMMGGRAALVGFGLLWSWLLFLPELAATRITEAFVLYRCYPWIPGFLTTSCRRSRRSSDARPPRSCVSCASASVGSPTSAWPRSDPPTPCGTTPSRRTGGPSGAPSAPTERTSTGAARSWIWTAWTRRSTTSPWRWSCVPAFRTPTSTGGSPSSGCSSTRRRWPRSTRGSVRRSECCRSRVHLQWHLVPEPVRTAEAARPLTHWFHGAGGGTRTLTRLPT